MMFKLSVLTFFIAAIAAAQAPDCVQYFTFDNTGTVPGPILPVPGNTSTVDNRNTGCVNWIMVYESSGFSVVSLTFQSASGATTPGSLGPFSGSVTSGSNPATNTTSATTILNGYVGWWNVALTATGTGTLRGSLYGYRAGYPPPTPGPPSSGCVGTASNPCVVDGPNTPGSASTKPPVQVAGNDGTDVRAIATDTGGRTIAIDGQPANVTATWNSGTALNTALSIPIAGYSNVAIEYLLTGTISAGVITFEITYDPAGLTGWIPVAVAPVGLASSLPTTYTLSGGSNGWQMYVGGFSYFRVRLSTAITNTGSAFIAIAQTAGSAEFPQYIAVDASGRAIVTPQAASGAPAGNPFPQGAVNDGGGAYVYHAGTDQAAFTLSSGTAVKIISGSAGRQDYIYHLSFLMSTAATVEIVQGTTSSTPCDTSTVVLWGPSSATTLGLALDFGPYDAYNTTVSGSDVCLIFGGTVTAGGGVKYAQY